MTDSNMASARRLYATLRECGATLRKGENGKILLKAHHNVLSAFRADIRAHRAELLVLLDAEADADPRLTPALPPAPSPRLPP